MFYQDDSSFTNQEQLPKEVDLFTDADEIEEGRRTAYDDAAETESDWRRLEIVGLCDLFHV